jgi:hypothetical protein
VFNRPVPPLPFYVHHQQEPEDTSSRYFHIQPVTVVTRGRIGAQTYTHSLHLFHALEYHARRGNVITGMTANGLSLAVESLSVLNCYLRLHRSLSPFWKLSRWDTRGTKYQWEEFSHHLHFTWRQS